MGVDILSYGFAFVVYVLLQGLVLNHINFLGEFNPYLYVLFILHLPTGCNRTLVQVLAFLLGLSIDFFSGTIGVNAGATLLLGFLKPHMDNTFSPREDNKMIVPGFRSYGMNTFIQYASILVLVHHLALFALSAFTFDKLPYVLLKGVCSTLFTLLLIFIIEYYRSNRRIDD